MVRSFYSFVLILALAVGCASSGGQKHRKAGKTKRHSGIAIPDLRVTPSDELLTPTQAERLVEGLEVDFPTSDDPSVLRPNSASELLTILKRDQVTLFPAAAEFVVGATSPEMIILGAQIQLAWGEAYAIVSEVLNRASRRFDIVLLAADPIDLPAGWGKKDVKRLDHLAQQISRLAEAFQYVSVEHVSRGLQLAKQIIATDPTDYRGYRIAADYYRTVREWRNFEVMVDKVEEIKPDSIGLLFLRGAAAFYRVGDAEGADTYYREALELDPDFVRAQAHLVLIQTTVADTRRELKALEALNPDHQLVLWTKDVLALAARIDRGR